MEKLKLELERLEVTAFDPLPRQAREPRGTVHAHVATQACSYNDACPTRLCTDRC